MQKKLLFKKLHTVDKKSLQTRKKIDIYLGVDTKGYYNVIISQTKSSRILANEVMQINALVQKLESLHQIVIKKRHYLYDAPVCSKAVRKFKELGWKIYDFS
jgi:hypothetical protein